MKRDFRETLNAKREKENPKVPSVCFHMSFFLLCTPLCEKYSLPFVLYCEYTETERLKCIYEGGYVKVLNDAGNIFFDR